MTAHRIRRLRWQVSAATEREALASRLELRTLHDTGMLAGLERAFDAAVVGDETIRIPKLEVRLRLDDLSGLEQQLEDAVSRQLAEVLFASATAAQATRPMQTRTPGLTARDAGRAPVEHEEGNLLRHYLRHGVVPWHDAGGARLELLARLRLAAAADPASTVRSAPATLVDAVAFFERWLQLLPASAWPQVAQAIDARAGQQHLVDAVSDVAINQATALPVDQRERIVALMLSLGLLGDAASVATGADTQISTAIGLLEFNGPTSLSGPSPSSLAANWLRGQQPDLGTRTHQVPGRATLPVAVGAAPEASAHQSVASALRDAVHEPADGVLTVANAGLVLLHPFLPRLFAQTGLLDESGRLLDAARHQAAALLSFAATGVNQPFEFELPFVKVLLGLDPETALPVSAGRLRPDDLAQVAELLDSVIEHWSALKKTSAQGLRAAYLTRPGLLADRDGGWQLRIEPQTFDVLLGQLPWGIGTIVLPWMNRPIFTDWPTSR